MTEEIIDGTRRFVIAGGAVRGEYVRLRASWQALLATRAYPDPVISLLGECLAATTLFASTVKMLQADGRLSIQIQGGKPVSLLVAECREDLSVRAMARIEPAVALEGRRSLTELADGASFAVTIDPGGDYDAYQSLVPMEGSTVADALDEFMSRSEQIESHFALAANRESCAGFLVQKVPQHGGKAGVEPDEDAWNRIHTLSSTITSNELLELSDTEVLHRLFHQEEVRLLPERPVTFACRCSKGRVSGVLKVLGREEVQGLLADRRTIEVGCDFCGRQFTFSPEEAWAALSG
jgi:molecular chaperone Hsp33